MFFGRATRRASWAPIYESGGAITGCFIVWKNDLRDIRRLNENLQNIRQAYQSEPPTGKTGPVRDRNPGSFSPPLAFRTA
jgi:hypothetical protein